jgi:hypothetical protein
MTTNKFRSDDGRFGSPRIGRKRNAGLVTAGVMTALLSGDVPLAVRATRLLMEKDSAVEPEARRKTEAAGGEVPRHQSPRAESA